MGGAIRQGELAPTSPPIAHALKVPATTIRWAILHCS